MNIDELKKHMRDELGLDEDGVSHVTEELLIEYLFGDSQEDTFEPGNCSDEELESDSEKGAAVSYGRYGNTLVFKSGKVHYKRGEHGTPNYGCGTDNWTWTSKQGDTFKPLNRHCGNGQRVHLLQRR